QIRSQYPLSFLASQARTQVVNITSGENAPIPRPPLADTITEARILTRNRNFQEAYEILQAAKKQVQEKSPAFYEIRHEEVELLLASDRPTEAELLLRTL